MPVNLVIQPVEGLKDLKAFIRFPYSIYQGDPYWVPPLDIDELSTLRRDKNPAFEYCESRYWLAYRGGKAVGRIAGIVNHRLIEKWGMRYARFGWVDFVEDFEVAEALVQTVENWARNQGLEGVQGPLGFTDLDKEGMLVEGFDQAGTYATIYNRPYYPEYFERLGYVKDVDWVEFRIRTPASIPGKVRRVNELIMKRSKVRVYEWKRKRDLIGKYGRQIFELIDESYQDLYGTCSLSEAQAGFYIRNYMGFVDPRFAKFLIDSEGRLVGFGLALPSLSRAAQAAGGRLVPFGFFHFLKALRCPEAIDFYLVAVRPEYKDSGIIALIMNSLTQSAIDAGIRYAETNHELETNQRVQGLWKSFDAVRHKRRRSYLKRF